MLGRSGTTVISALGVVMWHAAQYLGVSAQTCNTYVLSSTSGGFTKRTFIDFSGVTSSPGGSAASLLS